MLFAAAAAAALISTPALGANLLTNGGFEAGPANNNGTYYRGPLAPEGWSRVAGLEAPDIVSDAYTQAGAGFLVLLDPQEGDRFLDMNGASPTGGLYQDVTGLAAGSQVTLTYWVGQWAQNSAGDLVATLSDAQTLGQLATKTVSLPYAPGAQSSTWTQYTLTTIAPTSGAIRVQFAGNSSSVARGAPGLDNVALEATTGVPEPSAWALMICGLGAAGLRLRRRRSARA
ncbi:PEPxxWA-CTERM sorting domain-containing protein [Phenylobacterium sp.]|uniref:PEPxxWA-CTERM sorting domain-containing protein n=1 Tax=Phenylobacterium sp. TaxID=1871053 RepID=UPI0025CEE840|nr:PEPxxWA-CTERM sorting domain-containing protein [Phenylobacterium sp.]